MGIKAFLSPDDVLVDVRATDKSRLLGDLCKRAASAIGLNVALVSGEILKREELGSTGMGDGVAIPHARIQGLERPFGVLARLKKLMDFAAIDGRPVDLVFVLLLPGAPEGEQLTALASVARRLRNPEVMAALRGARDAADMYRVMIAE